MLHNVRGWVKVKGHRAKAARQRAAGCTNYKVNVQRQEFGAAFAAPRANHTARHYIPATLYTPAYKNNHQIYISALLYRARS